jgi:hypothetical protein
MKHQLSSFRRGSFLRVLCILILGLMCAPLAMAASAAPGVALPLASGSHGGSAFLAAGLGAGLLMLRKPEGGEGGEGGGGGGGSQQEDNDPAKALAQAQDKTLPISQRLGVAIKALQGVAPAEQFAKVKTALAAAQASLKTTQTELAEANARIKALEADQKELEETNAALEKEKKDLTAKEQDLDKRADAKASEKVASLGFPAGKLPGPDGKVESAASNYEDAMAQYAKITDPKARGEYYNKTIMPLLAAGSKV